jgi:hypothetical protein
MSDAVTVKISAPAWLVIFALSIVAALTVFFLFPQQPATISVQVRSLDERAASIIIKGHGSELRHTREFEISDVTGEPAVYTIELPAIPLDSIRIKSGGFIVDAATLEYDSKRYTWSAREGCTSDQMVGGRLTREVCSRDDPKMVTNNNSFIGIDSISAEKAISYSFWYTLMVAAFVAILFALAGRWLCMGGGVRWPEVFNELCYRSVVLVLLALYTIQLIFIYKYSIDIPFKDEWIYFSTDQDLCLPEHFTAKWLFSRFIEHSYAMINLVIWLNYKLLGLNYFAQKIINYLIFGLLLLTIVRVKEKLIGKTEFRFFPVFLIFLLSPLAAENHTWAFQSQIHFALLFFVLMLMSMAQESITLRETGLFILLAALSINSFAAGVVFAIVCLMMRNIKLSRAIVTGSTSARNGLINIVTSTLLVAAVIAFWFQGYQKSDMMPVRVWLNEAAFWSYFFNLLSLGFGMVTRNPLPGSCCLVFTLLPVALLLSSQRTRWQTPVLCTSTAIIGVLAVLMSITIGRAGMIGNILPSRYAEIGFILIPFVALAWWLFLRSVLWRQAVMSLFWLFCFCVFYDKWTPSLYWYAWKTDIGTKVCVDYYYRGIGNGKCQEFWVDPETLEYAKKMKIRFTRAVIPD